jgi:hypothetical protein
MVILHIIRRGLSIGFRRTVRMRRCTISTYVKSPLLLHHDSGRIRTPRKNTKDSPTGTRYKLGWFEDQDWQMPVLSFLYLFNNNKIHPYDQMSPDITVQRPYRSIHAVFPVPFQSFRIAGPERHGSTHVLIPLLQEWLCIEPPGRRLVHGVGHGGKNGRKERLT